MNINLGDLSFQGQEISITYTFDDIIWYKFEIKPYNEYHKSQTKIFKREKGKTKELESKGESHQMNMGIDAERFLIDTDILKNMNTSFKKAPSDIYQII